jgi:hypothetical protein
MKYVATPLPEAEYAVLKRLAAAERRSLGQQLAIIASERLRAEKPHKPARKEAR